VLRSNIAELVVELAAVTRDQDAVERGKKVGLEEVVTPHSSLFRR